MISGRLRARGFTENSEPVVTRRLYVDVVTPQVCRGMIIDAQEIEIASTSSTPK